MIDDDVQAQEERSQRTIFSDDLASPSGGSLSSSSSTSSSSSSASRTSQGVTNHHLILMHGWVEVDSPATTLTSVVESPPSCSLSLTGDNNVLPLPRSTSSQRSLSPPVHRCVVAKRAGFSHTWYQDGLGRVYDRVAQCWVDYARSNHLFVKFFERQEYRAAWLHELRDIGLHYCPYNKKGPTPPPISSIVTSSPDKVAEEPAHCCQEDSKEATRQPHLVS